MFHIFVCVLALYWVILAVALKMGYGLSDLKKVTSKTDTRSETTELKDKKSRVEQKEEPVQSSTCDDTTKTDHDLKHD